MIQLIIRLTFVLSFLSFFIYTASGSSSKGNRPNDGRFTDDESDEDEDNQNHIHLSDTKGFHDCCWCCGHWSYIHIFWEEGSCGFLPTKHKSPQSKTSNETSNENIDDHLYVHLCSDGWPATENWIPRKMKIVHDHHHSASTTTNTFTESNNANNASSPRVIGYAVELAVPSKTPCYYYFTWRGEIIYSNIQPVMKYTKNGHNGNVHSITPTISPPPIVRASSSDTSDTSAENNALSEFAMLHYSRDVVPRGMGWYRGTETDMEEEARKRNDLTHTKHHIYEEHRKTEWNRSTIEHELIHCSFVSENVNEAEDKLIKNWFAEKFVLFERLFVWCVAPHHRLDRVGFSDMLVTSGLLKMYEQYEDIRIKKKEKEIQKKEKEEEEIKEKEEKQPNENTEAKNKEKETKSLPGRVPSSFHSFKENMHKAMRHITIIAPIDQTARITTIENKFHQLYDKSSEQNLIQKKKLLMRSNKKHSDAFNKAELVSTQSLRLLLTLKKLSKKAKTETKFNIENRSRTHITASMLRDQQGRLSHQRSKSSKYFNCLLACSRCI